MAKKKAASKKAKEIPAGMAEEKPRLLVCGGEAVPPEKTCLSETSRSPKGEKTRPGAGVDKAADCQLPAASKNKETPGVRQGRVLH